MPGRPIRELGEDRVLSRLRALALGTVGRDVIVGSGDDAAVLRCPEPGVDTTVAQSSGDRLLLFACDMMVEGVHYRFDWAQPRQVGWKAMVQNLSDIAAMGGSATAAVASIAAGGDLSEDVMSGIGEGLVAAASRYGAALVGGDLVGSPGPVVVDVSILGWVRPEHLLLRRGAQPGDAVLVTGSLGAAAAGLAAREQALGEAESSLLAEALRAHHEPRPRLDEAHAIARAGLATAMMDLSDGLAADLPRLCEQSGVGARIRTDGVPVGRACTYVATMLGLSDLRLALTGGEDYELLLTCPSARVHELRSAVVEETGTELTAIGEITSDRSVVFLDADGREQDFGRGFDHFAAVRRAP
jgi:thiamine-monophosphate kinase